MNQPPPQLSPGELREAHTAALVVLGLLLFVFEAYLPRPVPWLKFGLANIATLIALYWMGFRTAVLVTVLRIIIGAMFTGTFLTPGFFLSFTGGLAAVSAMGLLYKARYFGVLTVSVGGAMCHNTFQLLIATLFFFKNPVLWYLLPYLLLTAAITGSAIGWFSFYLLRRIQQDFSALPRPAARGKAV